MSDDHETFTIQGEVEKNDGGNFSHKEADSLMDEFLEWIADRGLSFGGAMGVPSEPHAESSPQDVRD